MDFVEQKAAISKLTVGELRELPRDEIENFVATGLLEADLAAEVITENIEKKQDERQQADYSRVQAQSKKDDREKDADWLQHMSESYQRAYHQLMDTYDHAESQYGEIKRPCLWRGAWGRRKSPKTPKAVESPGTQPLRFLAALSRD